MVHRLRSAKLATTRTRAPGGFTIWSNLCAAHHLVHCPPQRDPFPRPHTVLPLPTQLVEYWYSGVMRLTGDHRPVGLVVAHHHFRQMVVHEAFPLSRIDLTSTRRPYEQISSSISFLGLAHDYGFTSRSVPSHRSASSTTCDASIRSGPTGGGTLHVKHEGSKACARYA
jgi:hypothetical protein